MKLDITTFFPRGSASGDTSGLFWRELAAAGRFIPAGLPFLLIASADASSRFCAAGVTVELRAAVPRRRFGSGESPSSMLVKRVSGLALLPPLLSTALDFALSGNPCESQLTSEMRWNKARRGGVVGIPFFVLSFLSRRCDFVCLSPRCDRLCFRPRDSGVAGFASVSCASCAAEPSLADLCLLADRSTPSSGGVCVAGGLYGTSAAAQELASCCVSGCASAMACIPARSMLTMCFEAIPSTLEMRNCKS